MKPFHCSHLVRCFPFDEGGTFSVLQLERCLPIKVTADVEQPGLRRSGTLGQARERGWAGREPASRPDGASAQGCGRRASVRCGLAGLALRSGFPLSGAVTAMHHRHPQETLLCFHNNEGFFSSDSSSDPPPLLRLKINIISNSRRTVYSQPFLSGRAIIKRTCCLSVAVG